MKKDLIQNAYSHLIFQTEKEDEIIIEFTNEITAFYKTKKAEISSKAIVCAGVSAMIFEQLKLNKIKTHYIKQISETELLCQKTELIHLEVIVRNVIAGSLSERLDIEAGTVPSIPIIDLCYKSDRLGDPLINDYHALALNIINKEDLKKIYSISKTINLCLIPIFDNIGISLIDFKLEFGYNKKREVILRDFINSDNARFWDKTTKESMDKDRFRQDKGFVGKAYREVYERLKSSLCSQI